ncbi:MAG: TIGR01777 family oxidoreductase [Candidatus Aminicenantes bacterium]|nr:TIGR01777 family oxidoreductase [Candidatus Aminicenantes bacterium]
MRIFITGGTGFIGKNLARRLAEKGHTILILTRSKKGPEEPDSRITYIHGESTKPGPWQEFIKDCDIIINLAGATIFSKWNKKQKKLILESRVKTTQNIVQALAAGADRKTSLISASAIGYYGFHEDEKLDESAGPGDDFLASVTQAWETEAQKAREKGTRVVITRFGIVLGEKGGALSMMAPFFKLFIGGPLGKGRQWFSWIHIRDLVEIVAFLIEHPEISGPVNACSPHSLRNKDLAKALGKALRRPSFLRAPAFMVRLLLGEFGNVVLKGQRVLPRRLLQLGFVFQFPEIQGALKDILGK